MTTTTAPATVTTERFGEISEFVYLNGRPVGDIAGTPDSSYTALPKGARFGTYWFPTRDAAVAACVSYAEIGYWTGECR